MKVLVVEPLKQCYVQEVSGLDDMQKIVGGDIEATYPFQEPVAVVCNADGKNRGLPYNRPLLDESGRPYDIVCGTFFLAGLGTEDFTSLTDDQIQRYKQMYDSMAVIAVKAEMSPRSNRHIKKKEGHPHER